MHLHRARQVLGLVLMCSSAAQPYPTGRLADLNLEDFGRSYSMNLLTELRFRFRAYLVILFCSFGSFLPMHLVVNTGRAEAIFQENAGMFSPLANF
jgi:hypothetical protein